MSTISPELIEMAKTYVFNLMDKGLPKEYVFHSPDHTLEVYKNSQLIGRESGFSRDDLDCLALAAIFHDIGYVRQYDDHEKISAEMAREFLLNVKLDDDVISQIERAIMATKVPQKPTDKISMALCDADLMHLIHRNYFDRIEKMRQEWKLSGRFNLSEYEFHKQSISFFEQHHYHTSYGKEVLAARKSYTLERIKAKLGQ